MDIQKRIDRLSADIDKQTAFIGPHCSGKLLLLGQKGKDSVFLRAVKRKADALGIVCDYNVPINPPYKGVVVDHEHPAAQNYPLFYDVDIDCLKAPGMSSVAQGVLTVLLAQGFVSGKTITIVGRGHAVKGLAQALIEENATVIVAHSKTTDLYGATANKDVVIYATPTLRPDQCPATDTRDVVIDLGGCMDTADRDLLACPYIDRIGKLTVSILLNRFVRGG